MADAEFVFRRAAGPVTARFQSQDGKARVDVERVEISGVAIEGVALDFAIDAFVRPVFPYAVVSEWFPLKYNVDRFTVNPSGVSVFIGRQAIAARTSAHSSILR